MKAARKQLHEVFKLFMEASQQAMNDNEKKKNLMRLLKKLKKN